MSRRPSWRISRLMPSQHGAISPASESSSRFAWQSFIGGMCPVGSVAVAEEATPAVNGYLPGVDFGKEPSIVIDHVSKWYGDIVAVSDVTFGVAPGVTALLGPNGAGKSTILKMMAGLIGSSSGNITIAG